MLSELITRGGPVMYVLFACSFVSLGITLERAWFWITEPKRSSKRKLCCHIAEGLDESEVSRKGNTFLQNVEYLKKQGKTKELAKLFRKESERSYERSIKFLSGLDTIVSIAPLLGILGTVLGIMKSFHALDLMHLTSPAEVSHGLAEAMVTTATGLVIAVPTLVFYNLFHSLAARHAASLYKLSEDFEDSSEQDCGDSCE